MKKLIIVALALAALFAVPATAQTLWRSADTLGFETGQGNRYSLLNGPVGLKSPLWLGTAPTGTSTDAWIYLTGQPSGFDYAIYSGSTLSSYFAGGISFAQLTGATLEFEGTTADAYETTLTVGDPTADRTITFPNATGTVLLGTLARIVPSSAPPVACAAGTEGTIYVDSDIHKACICNATNYVLMNDDTTTTGCS